MNNHKNLDEYLTTKEVAQKLKCRIETIYRKLKSGKLPPPDLTIERTKYWKPKTIQTFLTGNSLRPKFLTRKYVTKYPDFFPAPLQFVKDVINNIENDTMKVHEPNYSYFYPCKKNEIYDEIKNIDTIENEKTMIINIKEWLGVGCQSIRWEYGGEPDEHFGYTNKTRLSIGAHYIHNFTETILPGYTHSKPLGIEAFVGEIIIANKIKEQCFAYNPDMFSNIFENSIKYMIAEQLLFTFINMQHLIPAFMDWDSYWKSSAEYGHMCGQLFEFYRKSLLLSEESKKTLMEKYWPSHVKEWRKDYDQKIESC